MMLQIDVHEMASATVLRLQGEVDGPGMDQLRLALRDCVKNQRTNVILNMTEVTFVSYMGVGVLVERLRQLRSYGGNLKLVNINIYTQRLLRTASVLKLFERFDNEAQAVQSYQEAA